MKVLRVVGGLDAAFGGPPNSAANSVIATGQAGVVTTISFPHHDPTAAHIEPAVGRLREAGIPLKCFPLNRRFARFNHTRGVSTTLAAWLWQHAGNYDVIHTHSPWGLHSLAAVAAAARHRRPVLLTPHESLTRIDMSTAHSWWLWGLKRVLLPVYGWLLDAVVFSSALELADSVPARRPAIRQVIPHPVFDQADTAPERSPISDSSAFRIGYLGRLHPKKNIELLLRALTELPDTTHLLVAGDGDADYAGQLRRLAEELGVAARVDWLGFTTGVETQRFFSQIDLLAMPSRYECFGLVAAEAMQAGVAVLVSPETGVADVVAQHAAGVVVAADASAIAREIGQLDADRDRLAELARQGPVAARSAFSFSAHGTALRALYEQIVASRQGRSSGKGGVRDRQAAIKNMQGTGRSGGE